MSRGNKALIVLVVASLGVWGCAQGPANGSASAERIRALETKLTKLEDDFRATVAVREQLRKKLATAEQQCSQCRQQIEQLRIAAKERDELRQQLSARTSERDAVQNQFDQLRKGIRTLLGQAEAASGTITPSVTSATEPQFAGQS